jgi:thiol:disulfide interchange protein
VPPHKKQSKQTAAPGRAKPETRKSQIPLLVAIAVIAIVVLTVTQLKGDSQATPTTAGASSGVSPAAQLRQATDQGRPALVFMHSTDCIPCKQMMTVVEQVMPEFSNQVVLVDVNVYDDANASLLQTLRLQAIPTSVIFDKKGQSKTYVGVMTPADLRARLRQAMGGS